MVDEVVDKEVEKVLRKRQLLEQFYRRFEDVEERGLDYDVLIDFIEEHKELKRALILYVIDRVFDELCTFNLRDYIDAQNKFIPFYEDVEKLLRKFRDALKVNASSYLL